MNILYLTNHLNVGGITSYVFSLAKGLKARGHNIYVASSGGDLVQKFSDAGIGYIPIPMRTKSEVSPKILFSVLELSAIVKEKKIDLLHSHSRTTQVLGCLLSRRMRIPHIFTCHGFFKRRFFRKVFPCWGDKVIAISQQVKEHLVADFKVKEKDIRVIHNGIDADKFAGLSLRDRQGLKNNLGLGNGPVVGIIARLSDVKGHSYLIRAMKEVLKEIPGSQLLIVGDGKTREELVVLIRSLGIEKNIFFIPSVKDTIEALSVMDLFVLPSLKEGLGLSLMEAMAAGLPVIGSNIGGIKSLIRNDENGILVEPQDTQAIFSAISRLLRNPIESKRLGANAAVFIRENFKLEKMVSETERVYLECVSAA